MSASLEVEMRVTETGSGGESGVGRESDRGGK